MAQRGRKAGIEEIFKLSRDFDFLKGFSFYLNINLKHYVDISFSVSLINKTSVAGAVLQKKLVQRRQKQQRFALARKRVKERPEYVMKNILERRFSLTFE